MTTTTTTNHGTFALWLTAAGNGAIELTGWVEDAPDLNTAETAARTDYWPDYLISRDRQQLPTRLEQLGLQLAAGALLSDLDKDWPVYLTHPDLPALRARLDNERTSPPPLESTPE